ncbi:TonB-dependent receptor [Desulfatitalea alkaliphila]|uniref:TonB-dependent receptor n=1 Tax=Desulfatitalea alkaliphila TaxID=2929485 RepID=A0AA41UHL4_9BACT|nr:TonB-dependent receptor [Desulfatitalea alkaliphila]MCJ8499154.1 TonB-dependent receptor [Desulfatitalea alkaliphila]
MRSTGTVTGAIAAIAMIFAGGLTAMVWAQDTAEQPPAVVMGEVVVTASRQAEAVTRVPAHVTVITAEDIQRTTAQNVPEVLRSLAGVQAIDISGNQRNYNLDIRGFGESSPQNILLLVDGRRINLPDLSGPDWNLVPLERIERIEVIRGSRGNLLYGDNATAGVINIITKEGGALSGQLSAAYGSYDTFRGSASASGAQGPLALDITTTYLDNTGYRDNSDSDTKDVGLNLRIDPTEKLRLHVSSGYHYDDVRNPGSLLQSELKSGTRRTATTHPLDFDKTTDYYLKAGMELDMLSDDTFKIDASFRRRDKQSYGTYSGGYWFAADTETKVVTVSPQMVLRSDFDKVSNTIILGIDHSQAEQDYDSTSGFGAIQATLEKKNTGYFIYDELGIGSKLRLSGGYRYDRATFKYDPADTRKNIMDEEVLSVGINYEFKDNSHLYASFNRGFRYPVLDEQFVYATSSVNTSLRPENNKNYELGGRMEIVRGLVFRLSLFRLETQDTIFYNPASFNNENMDGKTIRQGIETGLSWHGKGLGLGIGYTYSDSEFDGGPNDGKEVPFVPRDRASAFISYEILRGLTLGLDGIFVGQSYMISDYSNDFPKAESYTIINAKVQYKWRRLTFFVDLNNLFNEKYSAYSGLTYMAFDQYEAGFYPSPEFNILAGVSVRFGGL